MDVSIFKIHRITLVGPDRVNVALERVKACDSLAGDFMRDRHEARETFEIFLSTGEAEALSVGSTVTLQFLPFPNTAKATTRK